MFKQAALATAAAVLMVWGTAGGEGAPRSIPDADASWSFAVSGDSRNCGDVVMPAIAASAQRHHVQFYWHLGDFRAIYRIDEDYAAQKLPALRKERPGKSDDELMKDPGFMQSYLAAAWQDFQDRQLARFDPGTTLHLGIGNHDTIPPKTRQEYVQTFSKWLGAVRGQPSIYYHWSVGPVDFINLDNASAEEFEDAQMQWFEKTLHDDEKNAAIKSIVVGMHKALPDSISYSHSMNEPGPPNSPYVCQAVTSGRKAYRMLLQAQQHGKHVYVIASHSHFYMEDTFNTAQWRKHGGVLPGWIVGTAGAQRYRLPNDISGAQMAVTDVYGYMLGTVQPNGSIEFRFQQVDENGIPDDAKRVFTPEFITWCMTQNRSLVPLDKGPMPICDSKP